MKILNFMLLFGLMVQPAFSQSVPWADVQSPQETLTAGAQVEVKIQMGPQVDAKTVRVEMDGTDLTAFLNVADRGAGLQSPTVLTEGPHELILTAHDTGGIPLPPFKKRFTVQAQKIRSTTVEGGLSGQWTRTIHREDIPPQENMKSGTARGGVSLKSGHWQNDVDVTTIYNAPLPYVPSTKAFDLSAASYRLMYERQAFKFSGSLGQGFVDLSPLTVASYSTRGGTFHLETGGFGMDAFSLDTRRPFGWSGGVGPGSDTATHVNGFKLTAQIRPSLGVFGIYLKGTEANASSYNISTESPPVGGDVKGLGAKVDLGSWSAQVEATQSRKEGEEEKKTPRAYRLLVSALKPGIIAQLTYQRVEEGYATPGAPYLSSDREDAGLMLQMNRNTTSAGLTLGYQHDNLSGESLYPALKQWRGGFSFSQGLTSALTFTASYNTTRQSPESDSTGFGAELGTQSATAGLGLRLGSQFLQYNANLSRMDDFSPANNDSRTYGHQLTYMGSAASWLDISSSVQLNMVRPVMQQPYTRQIVGNLDFRTRFFQNRWNMDAGGSFFRTEQTKTLDTTESTAYHFRVGYIPLVKVPACSQSSISLDLRQTRTTMAGHTQTTMQVLLAANLNLSGRYAHVK
jgi:hypothetical protein